MPNPYKGQPPYTFWQQGMAEAHTDHFDPVTKPPFRIAKSDRIATSGSCFAQHISRALASDGFNYLVTEQSPNSAGAKDENYGTFSARFGNVYTVRQLLQLFDRAYGLFEPHDSAWQTRDGYWIDPFRPRIQEGGFASAEEVLADRVEHLAAVRTMFEKSTVFVFTLGLTEAWASDVDGAVFPLAPGVVRVETAAAHSVNFTVGTMVAELKAFVEKLQAVNPAVKIILTVSPVPLIATFEDRHVLVSTVSSKSALRVVAEEVSQWKSETVAYFPSYEIVMSGGYAPPFFEPDLRSVTEAGVARVMNTFRRNFTGAEAPARAVEAPAAPIALTEEDKLRMKAATNVICDEEAIVGEDA